MERKRDLSGHALLVLIGCMVCQTGAGLFYASQTLAPDVIGELGWTRAMWSSAMAPMLFVSSVSQAFVGAACVRFGVRPVVVSAVLLLGVTFVVLANIQELWHFYIATTLLALANAGFGDVAIGAVVTRWFRRARGVALGVAMVGSNLGAVLFVHLMAVISEGRSWREAALQVGLGGVAVILPFALFVVREPRVGEGAGGEVDAQGETTVELPSSKLSEAIRRPIFWIFFLTLFTYALAQLGMANHLILYLMDLGYSKTEAAGALEFAMGAGIAAKLGAGIVALRLTARTALITNTLLLAASFALIPFAAEPVVLGLFGVSFGIATASRDVLFPLLLAEVFGVRYFAQLYGFFMLAYFPGGGLGPMALGHLHDVTGSYSVGFGMVGALLVVVVLGLTRIRVPDPA
jgi:predicted MFS family arabinose efflux permease